MSAGDSTQGVHALISSSPWLPSGAPEKPGSRYEREVQPRQKPTGDHGDRLEPAEKEKH